MVKIITPTSILQNIFKKIGRYYSLIAFQLISKLPGTLGGHKVTYLCNVQSILSMHINLSTRSSSQHEVFGTTG